jgi:PleD family two-component response regulator
MQQGVGAENHLDHFTTTPIHGAFMRHFGARCVLVDRMTSFRRQRDALNNRAYETSPAQCAVWNRKQTRMLPESRRVLIGLSERVLGASLASLFELKGFPTQLAVDASSVSQIVGEWRPHVLFIDTRVGACGNYAMVQTLREADDDASRLIIAMSGFLPEEPITLLKEAGYDGHCRRPCPVWQMTDLLEEYFLCRAVR